MRHIRLTLLFTTGVCIGVLNAHASIPADCEDRIVAEDTLEASSPASLAAIDPASLGDPRSLLSQHVRFMNDRIADGSISHTGALKDLDGTVLKGLTIFATDDLEAARSVAESDPFVKAAVVRIQYRRWNLCR